MTLDEAIKHAEDAVKVYEEISLYTPVDFCGKAEIDRCTKYAEENRQLAEWLKELKQLREQTRWIPCSERLPEDLEPVNITWVNHNPNSYYADIKDKPFTATGHYCNGRWWWYSATCQDFLAEYGHCPINAMDDAIEVITWMPLPEPYKTEIEVEE